jgi:hypothetical protein
MYFFGTQKSEKSGQKPYGGQLVTLQKVKISFTSDDRRFKLFSGETF